MSPSFLRRPWCRRIVAPALVLYALGLAAPGPPDAAAQRADEYQVKAAVLVNMTKFVGWPLPPDPLVTCVVGDPQFGSVVAALVRGEQVNGNPVQVRSLAPGEPLTDCNVVFVSEPAARAIPDIVVSGAGRAILTVGETPTFLREGGMIRLFTEGNRLRFQIDAARAEAHGLRINAQLLSLAAPL